MRFLHTSDWHLGRTLSGFSLHEAQSTAVAALVDRAIADEVDAFVIAGDVFDRAIPPVESIRLLNDALARLDVAGITAIVVAGNHDSGERLAMYSELLRSTVHVVGTAVDAGRPVVLTDEHGDVLIYPLPYLEPDAVRTELCDGDEPLARSHEAVMVAALGRIQRDRAARGSSRTVIVGHAYVGAESLASDSERDVSVGGIQGIPSSVFAGLDLSYVALGHLHRPQRPSAIDPLIHYSGSLLRYSLSEADHEKSAVIVDIGAPGSGVEIRTVPIPQPRGMSRLRGTLEDLLGSAHLRARQDFVELVVTDVQYPDGMHAQLSEAFPFALVKRHEPDGVMVDSVASRGDARNRDPLDVLQQFISKVTGVSACAGEIDLLRGVIEEARSSS